MSLKRIYLISLSFLLSFAFFACSKDNGKNAEEKGYIPEPAASSEETPGENTAENKKEQENAQPENENSQDSQQSAEQSSEGQPAEEKVSDGENSASGNDENKDAAADSGKSDENVASNDGTEQKTDSAAQEDSAKQENNPQEKEKNETADGNLPENAANADDSVNKESAEENGKSADGAGEDSKDSAAQPENAEDPKAEEPKTDNNEPSAAPKSSFQNCEQLYSNMEKCVPFKCSIPSNFLGKILEDTYEIKGMRGGKCRYVTGIYMKEKNKVSETASIVCNFTEEERKKASAYVKDTKNLKSSLVMGIKEESADIKNNPFIKFFADNSCVKACKKYQTETEKIELLENGRFITIRVRCPSED